MSPTALPPTTSESSSTTSKMRPPPLDQSDAVTSLLSLGFAAAASPPAAQLPAPSTSLPQNTGGRHHRRLSSIGKTRRRLSDAKEASTRPLLAAPASTSTPSTLSPASLSLAGLTLSTSPASSNLTSGAHKPLAPRPSRLSPSISASAGISVPGSANMNIGVQIISGSAPNAVPVQLSSSVSGSSNDAASIADSVNKSGPITIGANGKSKKRGIEYKCESCGKVYRHPNCLNKHRWEHTQQWREASKFMQSKHSQVQILEAATILSYRKMDINGILPDDKTEWPSFLSGGSLPGSDGSKLKEEEEKVQPRPQPQSMPLGYGYGRRATSASYTPQMPIRKVEAVPITLTASRNTSSSVSSSAPGPRLREFAIPNANATSTGPGGVFFVPHGIAASYVKDEVEEDIDVDVDDEDQPRRRVDDDDDIDIDIDVEEEEEESDDRVKERTYDVMSLSAMDVGARRTHVRSSSMRSSSSPRNPGLTGSASASSGDDEDEDVELELEGPAAPVHDKKQDVVYGSAPSSYGYGGYGYPYPRTSSYLSPGYVYPGYPASSAGAAPPAAAGFPAYGSYGSTSGPGFSPSSYHNHSGSFSASFGRSWDSVREEEEGEEEEDEEAGSGGVSAVRGRGRYVRNDDEDMDMTEKIREKGSGTSQGRWDGMEMEVDNMDMD